MFCLVRFFFPWDCKHAHVLFSITVPRIGDECCLESVCVYGVCMCVRGSLAERLCAGLEHDWADVWPVWQCLVLHTHAPSGILVRPTLSRWHSKHSAASQCQERSDSALLQRPNQFTRGYRFRLILPLCVSIKLFWISGQYTEFGRLFSIVLIY